jgi:hypothetical protein
MWKYYMIFLSHDLSRAARFPSTEAFATEVCKHGLPFRPVGKVGTANRFAAVDYCLAVVAGQLRGFGLTLPAVARLLDRVERTALQSAIEQFEIGNIREIYIGISAVLDREDDFSAVFTGRAAVADALADLDLIVISVSDRLENRMKGIV